MWGGRRGLQSFWGNYVIQGFFSKLKLGFAAWGRKSTDSSSFVLVEGEMKFDGGGGYSQ